ncbi:MULTISPECIES: AMP-binding protein [unclassified Leptolyngbya]|uniref:AMP-binding protein n=1 Tax=unclassified Leptolyngbya TaxID=2650499 RepID=UPI0016836129|nr:MULTISPECIES: AMP-binding protein [unclassified Leptolyngbya]MBD1912670.1 AMP-binding protein [Leptolyngbya sp. FACHB-8]MBD2154707.1 AMP-binding protein [Leptolyngbya sp. FACHB-16]
MPTITDILHQQVELRPHNPAILDPACNQFLSFAELEGASIQVAARLLQDGLQPGDTVLIFQPMSAKLYIVLLALFRLGLVAMFVDPSAGRSHLEQCCAIAPPQALIASPKAHLLRLTSSTLRQIPRHYSTGFTLPQTPALNLERAADSLDVEYPMNQLLQPSTPALLTFTSGSTGQPKAALRTHGFLLAQHRVLADSLSLTPDTIDLSTLPIFVLANLASGVTSLIPNVDLRYPGKIDAARVMQQIQRYRPVSTAASPAFLDRLADYAESYRDDRIELLSSFQRIFSGGAPVFPDLLERLQRLVPDATVTAVYGSTEAEPIAHIDFAEIQEGDRQAMQQGSGLLAGPPVSQIQLRILKFQWGTPILPLTQIAFDAQCLSSGEIGEIVVSGDHVLSGYWQGQGDAETKFRVDDVPWHRTGDAGYKDAQGRVWLLGRCSARIEDDRGTLYPFAVEAAVRQYPQVRRSALVSYQGKRLLAVEWAQEGDIEVLRSQLAWAGVEEVRSLKIPVDRRHNAKVDYPTLYNKL